MKWNLDVRAADRPLDLARATLRKLHGNKRSENHPEDLAHTHGAKATLTKFPLRDLQILLRVPVPFPYLSSSSLLEQSEDSIPEQEYQRSTEKALRPHCRSRES